MKEILQFAAQHGLPTVLCLVLIFRIEKAIYKLRDSIDELKDKIKNRKFPGKEERLWKKSSSL